ncbi:MAG: 16S rRNA (guanine(966)-N(2))-methyltransferase RsmD [Candidatus Marinimicrobia bacterium]|nr:16S rRNA (guanine(966)-N(2))-methyltransferase RsmD [Candidatus Neomarinimicrobiota bacterium]
MNIISGTFKSIKIKTSKNLSYRPTKSIVRKSIFDSLSLFNLGSVCDLFSGTGIIGFESASRGAKSITFVDNDYEAIKLIKENAKKFGGPQYSYVKKDVFSFIKKCTSFDLIYADPPYGKYDVVRLVREVLKHLNEQGKFFLECDKNQVPFLNSFVRDFGQTRILQWENK